MAKEREGQRQRHGSRAMPARSAASGEVPEASYTYVVSRLDSRSSPGANVTAVEQERITHRAIVECRTSRVPQQPTKE